MQAQAGLGVTRLGLDVSKKTFIPNWIDKILHPSPIVALSHWIDAFNVANALSLDTGKRHRVYSIVFSDGVRGWKIKEADISGAS